MTTERKFVGRAPTPASGIPIPNGSTSFGMRPPLQEPLFTIGDGSVPVNKFLDGVETFQRTANRGF